MKTKPKRTVDDSSRRLKLAALSLGVGISSWSCRVPNSNEAQVESADSVMAKTPEQQKAEAEVASFDKLRADLNMMNQTAGAKAKDKLDMMWKYIVDTKQPDDKLVAADAGVSPIVFGNGSAERFWRIFIGWAAKEGGSEVRPSEKVPDILKKYIRLTHRYSVFAKLKYVPTEEAKRLYTGQYAEGNDHILGRFSSAVPPSVPDRFTPAFSSKFFLDGKNESQVLITQHDVGGQSVGKDRIYNNYWEKPLSNRLSFEKDVPSGVGAFSRFYYTAKYFSDKLKLPYVFDPRELQADHLSEMSPSGQRIEGAKGPRFVWTVAGTPALKSHFQQFDKPGADYRDMFLTLNKAIPEIPGSGRDEGGVVVMRLYGSDTWTYNPEADATLLGELVTTSKFVASDAADQRLFFRHSISFFHYVGENSPNLRRFEIKPEKGRNLEAEVNSGAYTLDYPYSLWNTTKARDELFTSDCRLGVRESEVIPVPTRESLNGTFIIQAILTRYNKEGKLCAPSVLAGLAGRMAQKAPKSEIPAKVMDPADKTFSAEDKGAVSKYIQKMMEKVP